MASKLLYNLLKVFYPKKMSKRPANIELSKNSKSFYDFQFRTIDGKDFPFSQLKGKKVLIVNTASKCGFTPQYEELETLYQAHKSNLYIIGFPSNNFGEQEKSDNKSIQSFCEVNYGVSFQIQEKSDVIGVNQNEIYHWLTTKSENGWNDDKPKWNFTKFIISETGELIAMLSSSVSPLSKELTSIL